MAEPPEAARVMSTLGPQRRAREEPPAFRQEDPPRPCVGKLHAEHAPHEGWNPAESPAEPALRGNPTLPRRASQRQTPGDRAAQRKDGERGRSPRGPDPGGLPGHRWLSAVRLLLSLESKMLPQRCSQPQLAGEAFRKESAYSFEGEHFKRRKTQLYQDGFEMKT